MTRPRVRPTPAQLETHPSMAPGEYRLAFEEAFVAEVLKILLERMPTGATNVIHEVSALLKQPTNSKRKAAAENESGEIAI